MSAIIEIENLSKRYLVGHQVGEREKYTALRDVLARSTRNFLRSSRDMLLGKQIIQGDEIEEFWALKDISLQFNRGDVVGVIGRNGAGKSTLLKVLSRITEPTEGSVTLRGRVASLLEVGTGFHPELTGRENIFLNGAILGMSRAEIKRKFDEIVEFAEIEKFLDTPVKRYSSGMYVRLAFSVAAHLEPEILVVDEVLAVGDLEFQKKCLGKMNSVSHSGRTILFVSHNIGAIRSICQKGVLLSQGRLVTHGNLEHVLDAYLQLPKNHNSRIVDENQTGILSARCVDEDGNTKSHFLSSEKLKIEFTYQNHLQRTNLRCGIRINNGEGVTLTILSPEDEGERTPQTPGRHLCEVEIPANTFLRGYHRVCVALWDDRTGEVFEDLENLTEYYIDSAAERAYRKDLNRGGLFQVAAGWNTQDANIQ